MTQIFRRLAAACCALILAGVITEARAETDPAKLIDSFHEVLLSVMKDADRLGYAGRAKALEPAIERTFDIPMMTRIVVGSSWSGWSDDQRNSIIDAFRRFIVATYARRFDGYSGERFQVDGTRPASGGILVATEVIRPADSPITLNYMTRSDSQGQFQVVDVFLTGTISELATRRSEFGAVLNQGGYKGLLDTLEQKAGSQAPSASPAAP